ncbi:MAG: hypothetical protein ACK5N8_04290 [Alphaproteobacteria bacterium]
MYYLLEGFILYSPLLFIFFSDILGTLSVLSYPIIIIAIIVLSYKNKLIWLNSFGKNYPSLNMLLSILGGYFYAFLILDFIIWSTSHLISSASFLENLRDICELMRGVIVIIGLFAVIACLFMMFYKALKNK